MSAVERLPNEYIAKALFDLDGPLSMNDLLQVYELAFQSPDSSMLVELGTGTGQLTCALALGCRGTLKKVVTLLPEKINDPLTNEGQWFALWHRAVIRKHLVPYVTPLAVTHHELVSRALRECTLFVEIQDAHCRALSLERSVAPMHDLKIGAKIISVAAHG